MEQVTNLGEVRKKRKRKKLLRAAAAIIFILAVTYGAAAIMNHQDYMGPASFFTMLQGGEGYPVEAPGGKSKGLYTAGGNLAVVNDTDLFLYNTKGSQIFNVKHHMANPLAKSAGNFLLMFDRGGKGYSLYNRVDPVADGKMETPIYTGAVAQNGVFAIATRGKDYLSQVTVYSRSSQEQYSWNYADKMATNIALSPNGNKMAVAALYTQDGVLHSQLLLYNDGQLVETRDFEDEVVCHLLFTNDDTIVGITDATAFSITSKGKLRGEFHYQGQGLSAFAATEHTTVLLLGSYQQNGGYDLISLTEDMLKESSAKVQGTVHQICADDENAYILAGNRFYQCNLKTGALKVETLSDYVYDIIPLGRYVYAVTNEQITRTVKEDISQWQTAPQNKDQEDNPEPEPPEENNQGASPPPEGTKGEEPGNVPEEENSEGSKEETPPPTEEKPQGVPGL